MVQTYTVFGRRVGSHWLSMATLGTTAVLSYVALGGKKAPPPQQQQQDAVRDASSTADEEAFIKEFLKQAEADEQKAKR